MTVHKGRPPTRIETVKVELYEAQQYNYYKGQDQEGNDCSIDEGDYFMRDMDDPLPITLLRKVLVSVIMPDGELVHCWGWSVVSEETTRREMRQARADGGIFQGDTYTL